MAEKELTFRTFDEISGLNGEISERWNQTVKCAVFVRENYQRVFQELGISTDPIVYVLCSLKEIPSKTRTERPGISSTVTMSRKFYIGQSSTGLQRISQHCGTKDSASWWEIGVAFYSRNFTLDIIHSLEKVITKKASVSLPEYALFSDPGNTFEGHQEFPVDEIVPFIGRILGWLGIDLSKESSSSPEIPAPPHSLAFSNVVIFENDSHTAKLSLNSSTREIKLLKGSFLADPDSDNKSLSDTNRATLRRLSKDDKGRLLEDYVAHSPSEAAILVTGRATNGKTYWISAETHKIFGEYAYKKGND